MDIFEARHIAASLSPDGRAAMLFSDVSLTLEEGRIYDLAGPSGSGKSTLLRVFARMICKAEGSLFLDGKESTEFTPPQWRHRVCLVPQTPTLIDGTVRDNLLLPWKLKVRRNEALPTDETLARLLRDADLEGIGLDRDTSQLSGGQTARIALLRAFATKPRVLLLDEVDAALDDESSHAVGNLTDRLVGEGITCLRIRHRGADGFASATFTLRNGTLVPSAAEDGERP